LEKDNKYQEEEEEKLKLVMKAIDCIIDYCFDNGCILIFKKLKNICISKRKKHVVSQEQYPNPG
jgi:hypothetical protein